MGASRTWFRVKKLQLQQLCSTLQMRRAAPLVIPDKAQLGLDGIAVEL